MSHRPSKRAKLDTKREPFESSQEDYTQLAHDEDVPMEEDPSAEDPLAAIAAFMAPGTLPYAKQAAPMPSTRADSPGAGSQAEEGMDEEEEQDGSAMNDPPPAAAAAAASSSPPASSTPGATLPPFQASRVRRGARHKEAPDDEEALARARERQRKKNKRKDTPKSVR
jgi:hypothetical protein